MEWNEPNEECFDACRVKANIGGAREEERRVLERKEEARARLLGILPGKWRSIESETEVPGDRIHRERWMSLQACDGPAISFVSTGFRVSIDFNDLLPSMNSQSSSQKPILGKSTKPNFQPIT